LHFKREEDNFAMEMTPLIDVVFLLIIFFMVSTVFVDFSRRMEINLPSSKSSIIDEKPKTLEIEMSKDKKIFLAGKPITVLGLEQALRKLDVKGRKQTAIIKADKLLPYGEVIQVMGLLQKAGIPDISVAVK
jgi:biopolymer transport protein ExbD|tara:strand:- start:1012 stop:1407 length:396 start_codon:yes stop_codon:yes gene_type:complete